MTPTEPDPIAERNAEEVEDAAAEEAAKAPEEPSGPPVDTAGYVPPAEEATPDE